MEKEKNNVYFPPKKMEIKQSRADITYVPKCKELKDAIYFPTHRTELESYGKILEHYERKCLS